MKISLRKPLLIIVCMVVIAVASSGQETGEVQDGTALTDLAGREVMVSIPVEKVVLASARHLHEFAAVAGASFLDWIAGWGPDLKLYDQDTYEAYLEQFPRIAEVPEVGYHYKGTFSVEKVISLKPDVVLFPLWLVENEEVISDIALLEKAGIPSMFLDYWKDPFGHPVPSTRLLGTLLGRKERAEEIIIYYREQVDLVAERLETVKEKDKPLVYVEVGSKGAEEYGNTYGNTGWGAVVSVAGGKNIAEGVVGNSGPLSPEYLLKVNPDKIIITGSYWPGMEDSMRLGYHATEEQARKLLNSFTKRPGWETLKAVQENEVYSIFHGFSFRIYNFAGIQAFAKWFYPELFTDVDPAENLRDFHNRYVPVDYSGTWMIRLEQH
jgi:iron complex transport system substrate-binding protein